MIRAAAADDKHDYLTESIRQAYDLGERVHGERQGRPSRGERGKRAGDGAV